MLRSAGGKATKRLRATAGGLQPRTQERHWLLGHHGYPKTTRRPGSDGASRSSGVKYRRQVEARQGWRSQLVPKGTFDGEGVQVKSEEEILSADPHPLQSQRHTRSRRLSLLQD